MTEEVVVKVGGAWDRWTWAREYCEINELSTAQFVVLSELAYRSKSEGLAWPSQKAIAVKTRLTDRTVRRVIKSLEDGGALSVEQKAGGRFGGAAVYQLVGAADDWAAKRTWRPPAVAIKRTPRPADTVSASNGKVDIVSETTGHDVRDTRTLCPTEPLREPIKEPVIQDVGAVKRTPAAKPVPKKKRRRNVELRTVEECVVSEAFIQEMLEKHAADPIDVRNDIVRSLNHHTALTDLTLRTHVVAWLNKEVGYAREREERYGRKSGRGSEAGSEPHPFANLPTGVFGYDDPGA